MPAELEGAEVVPWDTVARYAIPTEIQGEFGRILGRIWHILAVFEGYF
eukprot:COSAG04_NODE_14566_length_563_cov_0.696121_1_plen_48_part_00